MPRRILVTGGSGFIGTNLVERYRTGGDVIVSLDPARPRHPEHEQLWQPVDVLDAEALAAALADFRPTHLLHFGARTDLNGSRLIDYDPNVRGVANVIEAVRSMPSLERVIFASSRMVCRIDHPPAADDEYSPPNAYGESKMVGELLVRAARVGRPWTIVRPTSIWGPWFDVPYKTFFLSVARGRYVNVRDRTVDKSFGFVGNFVHQIERILSAPAEEVAGRTLYLGDYPPVNVGEMAERIREAVGGPPIRTVPMAALRPAARAGDLAKRLGWREPPLSTFRLDNLVTPMVFDLSPVAAVAGTLPYSMEEGVRITVEWLRARGQV